MNLDFLQSNRFWGLVFGALIMYAKNRGVIGDAEFTLLETIIGGFIAIRTVDRLGEKIGDVDTASPVVSDSQPDYNPGLMQ